MFFMSHDRDAFTSFSHFNNFNSPLLLHVYDIILYLYYLLVATEYM